MPGWSDLRLLGSLLIAGGCKFRLDLPNFLCSAAVW